MRTLTECSVLQNAFLLDAKRNKSAQGEFSEFPPGNPKTPHTPAKEKIGAKLSFAPLSKGAKRKRQQEEKRDGNKRTSKDKAGAINIRKLLMQLRRGAGNRSARVAILT